MLKHFVRVPSLVSETVREWSRDNPSLLAAALSYYAFFSIIPLLVIAAALGTFIFGQAAVDGQLASMLAYLFGEKIAVGIQSSLAAIYGQPSNFAVAVAVLFILIGASYVFDKLRSALNIIWAVQQPRERFLNRFLEGRLLSLVMVTGLAAMLLLWISLSAAISALSIHFVSASAVNAFLMNAGDFFILFLLSALMFTLIYKLLPSVRLSWADVWLGAAVTSLFFTIGEYLFALYLSKVDFSSIYGAAGSMAALLAWLYASAHLFFFGAAFTKVYAHRHGSHSKKVRR